MTLRLSRFALLAAAAAAVTLASPTTGRAGLFHWLFGHHHGCAPTFGAAYYQPTAAYYNPCCPPACPRVTYYNPCCPPACPTVTYYAPAYDPCPPVCAAPSGVPAAPPRTFQEQPGGWNRTFRDDESDRQPMGGAAPGADDSGFRSRTNGAGTEGSQPPTPGTGEAADSTGRREARRPGGDDVEEKLIPGRQPAPPRPPVENGSGAEDTKKNSAESLRVPGLGLDEKITWRTTPRRTRLVIPASFSQPRLARTRVNPNEGWIAGGDGDLRLVSK